MQSGDDLALQDPGYLNPGYIDVLVPSSSSTKTKGVAKLDGSGSVGGGPRRPLETTPRYPIEQYDPERLIQVMGTASKRANDFSKKRKRSSSSQSDEHCNEECGDCNSCRHRASWDAFQPYIERYVPVKIQNVALFRDVSLTKNASRHELNEDDSNIIVTQDVPVLPDINSLPPKILNSTVTVQCTFPPPSTQNNSGDKESINFPSSPQAIDHAISLSNTAMGSIPTFMGQEDQVTTEMTLREAITWNEAGASDTCRDDSVVSTDTSSMAICVAQERILTTVESLHSTSNETVMQQHESSDEDQYGRCKQSIHILLDGQVKQSTEKVDAEDDISMKQLSSMLRLPSYLLLGDPAETAKYGDDHHSCSIVIQNINLWHAPQSCCTNVHYDDYHNILLVTDGKKTVELSPPGCIRGSGIYSEHANHPALLRRGRGNEKHGEEETSMEDTIRSEIEMTRDLKRRRTHVVSVSAGEAMYIPSGWWHRVESSSSSNHQTSRGCTAINIWFDYAHSSRSNVPRHMAAFQLRNSARKYYEIHGDHAAHVALKQKRQAATRQRSRRTPGMPQCSAFLKEEWKLLTWMKCVDFATADAVHVFGDAFSKCWAHFMEEVAANEIVEEGLIDDIISRFRVQIEYFLLFINLAGALHVQGLVLMWNLIPPIPSTTGNKLFSKLILGFSPESCFVITQAWERHASSTTCDNSSEVESSYKHFFQLAGNDNEKQVRAYLMNCVEYFRHKTCESYLMEGVLLGKI